MSIRCVTIRRFLAIIFYLMKHFSAYLISGILKYLPLGIKIRQKYGLLHSLSKPVRLKLFLQDIGGAPIKLAQIMAMRPDFLPIEYIEQLLKLLDEVPFFDPKVSQQIITKELRSEISTLFQTFEDEPMAAASFGQVHAATLPNGDEVVVKVQRPEVPDIVAADLNFFRLATFLVDAFGLTKRLRLKPIFEDFAEWTKEELDYRIEGSHIQQIYEKSAESGIEKIPKVYWELTSTRVLTLERLYGIWMKEIIEGLQSGRQAIEEKLLTYNTSLAQVTKNLFSNSLHQIFNYGIYHADPHAANLLVMENGVIGYVDFGIIGKISEKSKDVQVKVHIGLESGRFDRFYQAIVAMLNPPHYADLTLFEEVVRRGYTRWLDAQYMSGANIQGKSFARLMVQLIFAAHRSGVAFRIMEARVYRTLTIVDALLLQLAPAFDVRNALRDFFSSYLVMKMIHFDIPEIIHKLPMTLDAISDHLDEDIIQISTRVSKLRRLFSKSFRLLSYLLIAGGVIAFIMHETAVNWLTQLKIKPFHAIIITILAIVLFGWFSRIFELRSVIHENIVSPRKNRDLKDS